MIDHFSRVALFNFRGLELLARIDGDLFGTCCLRSLTELFPLRYGFFHCYTRRLILKLSTQADERCMEGECKVIKSPQGSALLFLLVQNRLIISTILFANWVLCPLVTKEARALREWRFHGHHSGTVAALV
jgi:hypothetical protein